MGLEKIAKGIWKGRMVPLLWGQRPGGSQPSGTGFPGGEEARGCAGSGARLAFPQLRGNVIGLYCRNHSHCYILYQSINF